MKILLTLTDEQSKALEQLMAEDVASNRSAFIAALIGSEAKHRKLEREKRSAGRPRSEDMDAPAPAEDMHDYTHDQPKNIPHFGRMIGRQEYQDIEEAAQAFRATL